MDLSEIFERVYRDKKWVKNQGDPLSGSGSRVDVAKPYSDFVKKTINDHKIKSVVDFGHGDWTMWGEYKFEGLKYTGIEIALTPHKLQQSTKNLTFLLGNYLEEKTFPQAELLISKDTLQHLSNKNIILFLEKINQFNFLIICNDMNFPKNKFKLKLNHFFKNDFFYTTQVNNIDVEDGEYRSIDLESEPFFQYFTDFHLYSKLTYKSIENKTRLKVIYFFRKI